MNPIEKVHKLIVSGKVLGPNGAWIPRTEALKTKRYLLNHVLNGEVEINGKWKRLSEIDTKPEIRQFKPPESISTLEIRPKTFPEERETEIISGSSSVLIPPPPLKSSDAGTVPLTMPLTTPPEKTDSPEPVSPSRPIVAPPARESLIDDSVSRQLPAASDRQPPVDRTGVSPIPMHQQHEDRSAEYGNLPPQPHIEAPGRKPEAADAIQNETVTIRTIPLGKETSLTISESRAGSALVAICSVAGFIDQSNSDDFHQQLISMLEFGVRFFIIDFEHTTLVGSAGWGVLAVAARLIKAQHGHLLICAMKEEIEESFYLLQFNDVIDAQKTVTDCLGVIRTMLDSPSAAAADTGDGATSFPLYGESYEDLPLPEKIKSIIALNGPLSFLKIGAALKQERYGKTKINPFKLYLLLKGLNLETRWKRVRYYRSC
ncbi:MAG: STAS domain-containing protein [Chitinispirillaceae bacterium]|nr:STAS domain-containing protein [Chitinispirillaceae bacterium]